MQAEFKRGRLFCLICSLLGRQVKYESNGVEALKDNRGKRKEAEQMTERERLRAEKKILRAEKECVTNL